MRGSTSAARPVMNRARAGGILASAKACRAAPRCSGSLSIVVSVARGEPCSSQRPETPAPVPISTMLSACDAAAMTAHCAPTAGLIGAAPSSRACARARAMCSGSIVASAANRWFASLLAHRHPPRVSLRGRAALTAQARR